MSALLAWVAVRETASVILATFLQTNRVTPINVLDQAKARGASTVPEWLTDIWEILQANWVYLLAVIAAMVLIGFMLVNAIFSVWLERKVAGRIQDRLGPTRVGGKFGWLQTLADGMKLLVKEDTIPASADDFLFRLGPYIALIGSFLAFLVLPYGDGIVAREMNIALFFMLAVMSSEVFGIILIGYGSGSKWSLFGGMREAAQMVSYEIPMALCVLVPVIVAGSMNLSVVARQQQGIWNWYVFHDPFTFLAFWTYFTCAMASCKRAPFDLAEAESELVAGFHTEYSGFRWLVIFMAEYGSMFAVSGIAAIMFLGGWSIGIPWELTTLFGVTLGLDLEGIPLGWILGNVINVTVFMIKGWLLVFVMMWVRWTLPRLRIDQVMMLCLKYLIPISCVLLLGVSLWTLFMPAFVQFFVQVGICVLTLAGVGFVVVRLITWASLPPGTGMPGMWRTTGLPGYEGAEKL
jgi:NADH-quinone oxidoreductase subunit H